MLISFYAPKLNLVMRFDRINLVIDAKFSSQKRILFNALHLLKDMATGKTWTDQEFIIAFKVSDKIYRYATNQASVKETFFAERIYEYDSPQAYARHHQVRKFFDDLIFLDTRKPFLTFDKFCSFKLNTLNRYFSSLSLGDIELIQEKAIPIHNIKINHKQLFIHDNKLFYIAKNRRGITQINEVIFRHHVNGSFFDSSYEEECSGVKQSLALRPVFVNKKNYIINNFDDGLHNNLVRYMIQHLSKAHQHIIFLNKHFQYDYFDYIIADSFRGANIFYKHTRDENNLEAWACL